MQYPGTQYSIQVHLLPGTVVHSQFSFSSVYKSRFAILHVRGRVSMRELSVNVLILFLPQVVWPQIMCDETYTEMEKASWIGSPPPPLTAACQLIGFVFSF